MTPRSVMVVCAANICRSPAAAHLLARRLAEAGSSISVTSAGVTAVGNRPVCDLGMSLVGVIAAPEDHRSRRLEAQMLKAVDLVVAMEPWQVAEVEALSPVIEVRLLGHEPIPDPHAIGYQAHAMVFSQLRLAVEQLAQSLVGR